ncbi:MAG: cyclase family protein [Spirochaetaceae bacterium]|nr:cyclase family protein [Myxococcales bacterium]MCB9722750.1 cyclase family protein [Spirochaetaceae bacterium]HPG27377.1 cyclase family protein [Myxococcota bacterium]
MSLADRTPPSPEEYLAYRERLSNWGRWGAEDELGTLNHLGAAERRRAAALVREGRTISLARPIDTRPSPLNPHPAQHMASVGAATGLADFLGLFFHGFAQTHIDALSHIPGAGGRYFNDRPIGARTPALAMPEGTALGIQRLREGIVGRGVLYDIPRLRGTAYVDAGAPVHGWDLEDAARQAGFEPAAGDIVCLRSGRDEWLAAHPDWTGHSVPAGVHASVCEFLFDTRAAMLCWDMLDAPTEDQGIPNPLDIDTPVHVHCIVIPVMGMPLLDNADLRELAAACRALDRSEFLFCAAPLVLDGGTGSPINPIALL